MKPLVLDGNTLTIEEVYRSSRSVSRITFTSSSKRRMAASRKVVEDWVRSGETIYGVTTGFGELSNVVISPDYLEDLQTNLIASHAAGAGEPIPYEVVRAMTILRLNALAKGYSGIRLETMEFLRKVFNAGVIPIIPSKGSVGSSGDLAPLAHLVLTLLGRGKVWFRDAVMDSKLALKELGLKPLRLAAKEGLALVNGTQMMAAYGVHAVHEAVELCKLADIAGAMSVETLKGTDTAFDSRIHALRPFKGQSASAANLRRMVNGSLSGLPRFLTENGGLNSGMMVAQYTAASMVSENKVLAHPASVDSIPTSANQEDHNSMGSISALKAWQVLRNTQTVLAIEFMVAAQGIDFSRVHPKTRKSMAAGRGVQGAHRIIRTHIKHLDRDRVLYDDIQTSLRL